MANGEDPGSGMRGEYQRRMLAIRAAFEAGETGATTIAARAQAMDELVVAEWAKAVEAWPVLGRGVALLAVGGYGRRELFPYSDVDLLFLLDGKTAEKDVRHPIRQLSQELWDCGIRLSPATRKAAECERFRKENAEFALALLDRRLLAGDAKIYERLSGTVLPKMLEREHKAIRGALVELTRERHAKYGDTLFHLEPNIKDCPGGLRDVHVCWWLGMLGESREPTHRDTTAMNGPPSAGAGDEFGQAVEFLSTLRCFLHYRHERDDNTLDWQAQDAASQGLVGLDRRQSPRSSNGGALQGADAAYWMRLYFRHARSVERRLTQMLEDDPAARVAAKPAAKAKRGAKPAAGFAVEHGRAVLAQRAANGGEPAHDPEVVLQLFAAMAGTGCGLERGTEERLAGALPLLSAHLEEGPALWKGLREILMGRHAGHALRAMHALGILELLIPEFHGIDALVVRDAYHRYTVDEHTFVVIDTLHSLEVEQKGPMGEWAARFGGLLRDLNHASLLYLVALMHDTGKGRSTANHATESARMAESVLGRLELDGYETGLVTGLIQNHLEMSAALRRDVFDTETVRAFAGKIQTPDALRMLTLFTFADIAAVHPDALTPWKAENLWRLYLATANYLDRSVDDERVGARATNELVHRVVTLLPGRKAEAQQFLEGFPERYLQTRTPEQVRTHFEMAARVGGGVSTDAVSANQVQLEFRHGPGTSEITLVTPDRALLFADMAGALAAWGMNIVTADAFSNRQGVVVDSFRFTDSYRTLEMNASEHAEFVASVHGVMTGILAVEKLLQGRRRGRRKAPKVNVEARVDFDDDASSHSTLVQVVAQDVPGLLRAIGLALAVEGCNIEVALVDTEGETAIDVFYVTKNGAKLEEAEKKALRRKLLDAMEANAQ
jgi:[protein-PII] uridylyltransferase